MHLPLQTLYLLTSLTPLTTALSLTLTLPSTIPALPPSTKAYLIAQNTTTLTAPIRRTNSFYFPSIDPPSSSFPSSSSSTKDSATASSSTVSYLLDIACRDYDFASYGLDVRSNGTAEIYRVSRGGGVEMGERIMLGGGGAVEVRVLRRREFYEVRAGFSPLTLLKNPMVLIGVLGLAFVMGMPYLMDSMDPEMKKEFEEQQKKSILSGGAKTANPLQNFDMAAWMAGKTSGSTTGPGDGENKKIEGGGGGGGGGKGQGQGQGQAGGNNKGGGGGGGGGASGRDSGGGGGGEGGGSSGRVRRRG